MLKKFVGVAVVMFLLAITAPVFAQRYNSCGHRGHGNGWHNSNRYANNYDREDRYDRRDRGRRGYDRYDRGRRNRVVYVPAYNYGPSYRVRRAPVRRYYSNGGYYNNRPRYRSSRYNRGNRGYISVSLGF